MKNVGLVGFAIMALVGCGSSDDSGSAAGAKGLGASSSAAKARFTGGPTAVLTGANGLKALRETKRQQSSGSEAMKGNPIGGGSGGASTQSIGIRSVGILGTSTSESGAASTCADIAADKEKGSCACPGGGKVAYEVPNLKALKAAKSDAMPDEVDISFSYDACVMDGATYGGSLGMLLSKKSVVKVDASASAASASDSAAATGGLNMLIVANDLTIGKEKLDFAFAMDSGKFYYAPNVDEKGSYVLSELSFTGETKVHAKNGTFACDESAGECKNEKTGEKIDIGSSTGSGAGSSADPTENP